MKSELIYRTGSMNDFAALLQLGILSYAEFEKVLPPDGWQMLNKNLHDETRLLSVIETSTTFLCEHNNTIVGMAYLVPTGNPNHIYPADWSHIRMVGVHPGYRGLGIARTLTQQCIDLARSTGEKVIALHTSEVMDAARHVYESLGFKVYKEIDKIFGVRYWLYWMELNKE